MADLETQLGGQIVVRSWRITGAEPHGAMMWFDPEREAPQLRIITHPNSEETLMGFEGAGEGTILRMGGVPRKGSEAREERS